MKLHREETVWKKIEGKTEDEILEEVLNEAIEKKRRRQERLESLKEKLKRGIYYLRRILHPLGIHYYKFKTFSEAYNIKVVQCKFCGLITTKKFNADIWSLLKGIFWAVSLVFLVGMTFFPDSFLEFILGLCGFMGFIYWTLKSILEVEEI